LEMSTCHALEPPEERVLTEPPAHPGYAKLCSTSGV
jgi:hypothetical protein